MGIVYICRVDIFIIFVHSKGDVIHSHSYRDLCNNVGVDFAWVVSKAVGRGTST